MSEWDLLQSHLEKHPSYGRGCPEAFELGVLSVVPDDIYKTLWIRADDDPDNPRGLIFIIYQSDLEARASIDVRELLKPRNSWKFWDKGVKVGSEIMELINART